MGFDPTISVLKWPKSVHALDRVATVIDPLNNITIMKSRVRLEEDAARL
jgi:hypothetical protein